MILPSFSSLLYIHMVIANPIVIDFISLVYYTLKKYKLLDCFFLIYGQFNFYGQSAVPRYVEKRCLSVNQKPCPTQATFF